MEYIGTFIDDTIGENYGLFSARLSEVRSIVKASLSRQGVDDVDVFDSTHEHWTEHQSKYVTTDVAATYVNNGFIYLQGEDDPWLLDGFTRIFKLDLDANVFVKVYEKSMPVSKTVKLLIQLNYWKTLSHGQAHANRDMLDRGFTLYTYMRTGRNISEYLNEMSPVAGYREHMSKIISKFMNSIHGEGGRRGYGSFSDSIQQMEYDRFFDDIALVHDLHKISFDLEGRKPGKKYLPINFYELIADVRSSGNKGDLGFDVAAAEKWIKSQPDLMRLAALYWEKQLSNGQESVRQDATQYFKNKYFNPVVLGIAGEMTEREKKEQFKKESANFKKQYKKLKADDYMDLPIGTKVYYISTTYPEIYTKEYEWCGIKQDSYKSYVFKIDGRETTRTAYEIMHSERFSVFYVKK